MFMNKKVQAAIAVISALATVSINTVTAVAVPYGHNGIEVVKNANSNRYVQRGTLVSAFNAENLPGADDLAVYSEVSENVSIAYNTVKRANGSLQAGTTVTVTEGVEGEKIVNYRIKYENGAEVSREVVSESVVKAPVDKVVEYGVKSATSVPSKAPVAAPAAPAAPAASAAPKEESAESAAPSGTGNLDYKYVLECTATAYSLSAEENGGYAGQTATGVPLDKGIIAVDPKVIPLGSRVYIEALDGSWSYGYALAADTGGAIKGNKVDLCFLTREECIQFGRRKCRVYILN